MRKNKGGGRLNRSILTSVNLTSGWRGRFESKRHFKSSKKKISLVAEIWGKEIVLNNAHW